jgi:hypothetical protein
MYGGSGTPSFSPTRSAEPTRARSPMEASCVEINPDATGGDVLLSLGDQVARRRPWLAVSGHTTIVSRAIPPIRRLSRISASLLQGRRTECYAARRVEKAPISRH